MVRIDPIIPYVNEDASELVSELSNIGVRHITASTYKAKADNWKRICGALPEQEEKLKLLFERGQKANGCSMLPEDLRLKLLAEIRNRVISNGMTFAVCREDLSQLNTASCDGSWLLQKVET